MEAGLSKFSARVFQLYILITIFFAFGICDKFHPDATKHDIDYLQSQIDSKSNQIENIHQRLNKFETLTSSYTQQQNQQDNMISALTSNMSFAMNSINQLQSTTNDIEFRTKGWEKRVGVVENGIYGLEVLVADLTTSFSSTMTRLNRTLNHLHEVNQIWKANFRNINITFHNIKKKVNFAIPSFKSI